MTKTSALADSIGAEERAAAPKVYPKYGWRKLRNVRNGNGPLTAEEQVCSTLAVEEGANVKHAGARGQDYDLEIFSKFLTDPHLEIRGLSAGKYEVKSFWRKNTNCKFDKRFKAGRRGERIYGRRDAQIKSFALALEKEIDDIIDNSLIESNPVRDGTWVRNFVDETHDFINQALERRHSKKFEERITRLAKASLMIPKLSSIANSLLNGGVEGSDIARGFNDINGIFLVADDHYTLISKAEMPTFLTFESASSEGPKIKYQGDIIEIKRSKI